MNQVVNRSLLLASFVSALAFAPVTVAEQDPIKMAIDNDFRAESNKKRDEFRHPYETLNFIGLKESMTVVELWPAKGWYSEIIAPVLKDKGKLVLADMSGYIGDDRKQSHWAKVSKKLLNNFASNSEYLGVPEHRYFNPPEEVNLGPDNSADLVLTFRNIHNWDTAGQLDSVIESIYKVLKPGGILGIVEHRADSLNQTSSKAAEGYTDQHYLIEVAKKCGFEFVASSEVNANSKDVKNYPKGVYALPPTFGMGKVNRAFYENIGESDRMTLKLMKPLK